MDAYKHIFLIIGEPRVGKTTLGKLANDLNRAVFIDTDQYASEEVLDKIKSDIHFFLEDKNKMILLIATGKYRKRNQEFMELVKSFICENIFITACRLERLTPMDYRC